MNVAGHIWRAALLTAELFIQPIRGMEIRALREKDNIHDDQIRMINQALMKEGIL